MRRELQRSFRQANRRVMLILGVINLKLIQPLVGNRSAIPNDGDTQTTSRRLPKGIPIVDLDRVQWPDAGFHANPFE